ncbi:PREDICTED: uncharacterized protein LOC18603942 [Theobroma cacao]|uniref:Uncharacterized protein LOC18603942 n=1 Tax=Theobroma cacao TaxID=3641 RepID=A0AB32VXJ4_THECC|nr:PREDICTED: uncharacterized protein LOC18603942 [Theobroma cacao]
MTQYLYSMTRPRFLIEEENKRQAVLVVRHCIRNKLFDVALDLLLECPQLAFAEVDGMNAVSVLSSQPSAFPSGNRLSFWQRWIYSCLKVKASDLKRKQPTSEDEVRINTYQVQDQKEMKNFTMQVARHTLGLWSNLLKFFGMKHIYDLKQAHVHAHVLLLLMSEEIAKLDFAKVHENSVHQAIMNAAQRGMTEFIVEIIKRNLDLLVTKDVDDRDMFKIAVAHRQEKVFNLIYGLDTKKQLFLPFVDKLDNSMFHVAGKLSSESQVKLEQISGPALQMQRELQWLKTAHDFLISLPNKLIIRLSSLFISIAAMMVAFSSTVFIMIKGQLEIIIPIVVLVGFPIGLFVWLQFPLLAKIFISTYGPGIFDRKMKKWL